MASLDDFKLREDVSLDDFKIQGPLHLVNSPDSNRNLAAYTAALSENPDSVEATYLRSFDQLSQEGSSEVVDEVVKRARSFVQQGSTEALTRTLADPEIPDEVKAGAIEAYRDENSSLYDLQNIVSTEALVAPVDDESEESSEARINFSDMIDEVNSLNRWKNQRLNLELNKTNQSFLGATADFLEMLAPFGENWVAGKTLAGIKEGGAADVAKGLAWMGGSKAEVRDALSKLPIKERRAAIEKAIDVVNNSSGIVLPGTNEFARAEMLQTMLTEGHYGTGEEFVDNMISFLDVLGLVGGTRRLGKAAIGKAAERRARTSLDTPVPTAEQQVRDRPFAETATDDELRAEEDLAEARAASTRAARAAEDLDRADAPARRGEARRAVISDDDSLRRMEDRAETRRTGGNAARMTDAELRAAEDVADAQMRSRVAKDAVKSKVQPSTLSQTYRNTNPTKARAASQAAAADKSGNTAQALYGASRSDAIRHDHLPEMENGGVVKNKVAMPDTLKEGPAPLNPRVMDYVHTNGATYLRPEQKAAVATRVVNDFNTAQGLVARTEMSVPATRDIGGRFKVGVTYGAKDSGFLSGEDALDRVKTSLRHYGVKDEDITLLRREGDDFVPVDKAKAGEPGEYLARVDYNYDISAQDITDIDGWSVPKVLHNYFDRMPHPFGGTGGTLQRTFMDPGSMFDKHILSGANNAVLRSAGLEKVLSDLASDFDSVYAKLPDDMKKAWETEVKRANHQGYNKSRTELLGEGWSKEAIEAIELWRDWWDNMYWMENTALAKTLRNQGYKLLEDGSSDTRLFVKEVKRGGVGNSKRVYDPQEGKMITLDPEQLDELYEKGGSVSKIRQGFMTDQEELADFIVVRNQPGGPYARRVRDDDQILNYREGYYTVYYDAPKIVEKIVKGRRGEELYRKPIAAAGGGAEARKMVARMQANEADEGVSYDFRDSRERGDFGGDETWSIQSSQGRVAQKVRGARLEDASSPTTDLEHNYVLGPGDAMVRSLRNIAPNLMTRDALDAMKEQAIASYGHMFPKENGRPVFPKNTKPENIRAAEGGSKEAADARSVVEYINSLERPYFNMVDDSFKYVFRSMADAAGAKGFGTLEKTANFAAEVAQPTKLGKGAAFTLYLVLNPLRQLLVQGHQATQLLALKPTYVMGQLGPDMAAMFSKKLFGNYAGLDKWTEASNKAELDDMWEAMEKSGTVAVIDKSNLVRGTMQEMADATSMGAYRKNVGARAAGKVSQGLAMIRKGGFDAGEAINKVTSWLTHYRVKKDEVGGRKLTQTEIDEVTFASENWTYQMSRAGEMAHNQNALGLVTQFLQVPQKAFLTMTTNRHLTWKQKSRLIGLNALLYGAPPGSLIYSMVGDDLPQEGDFAGAGEARQAILQGLEGYMFNRVVGGMYDFISDDKNETKDISFASLVAVDGRGLWEFATDLLTTDVGEIAASTPSGSLLFGNNPRITNAIKSVAELMHVKEPVSEDRTTIVQTLKEVGRLSSGLSNGFKALIVAEEGKKYNSLNDPVVDELSTFNAAAQLFGLSTVDEERTYYAAKKLWEKSKEFEDDVKEVYRLMNQELARKGIRPEEEEYIKQVMGTMTKHFSDNPRAQEIFRQQLKYSLDNGETTFLNRAMENFSFMEEETSRDLINNFPMDEEKRQNLHRYLDNIKAIRNEE